MLAILGSIVNMMGGIHMYDLLMSTKSSLS